MTNYSNAPELALASLVIARWRVSAATSTGQISAMPKRPQIDAPRPDIARLGSRTLEILRTLATLQTANLRQREMVRRLASQILAVHGISLDVEGPLPDTPCVFVANHVSYLDPLAICAVRPAVAVAKQEVRSWPVIGNMLEDAGTLFVDRSCAHSGARALRAAMRHLEEGRSVLNFPEGTTTDGELLPFRRGIFGVAQHAGVPVVPVAIRYESPELHWVGDARFMPHYLRTIVAPESSIHVVFGDPILAHPATAASTLARRAYNALRMLLATPPPPRTGLDECRNIDMYSSQRSPS